MSAPANRVVIASTSAGELAFTPNNNAGPDVPRTRKRGGQKAERPSGPAAVAAMRAARLLGSLAKVAAFRRQSGFTGRVAWDGLLALAAQLIVARAFHADRAVGKADLANWAQEHVPEAGQGVIRTAWAGADGSVTIPHPSGAGQEIDLRFHEWVALARPWGLRPIDASAERVEQVRRGAKRMAAAKRRAKNGACPRGASVAAFCRDHGLCARTYRRWQAKGEAALHGWLASKGIVASVRNSSPVIYREENTSDEKRTPCATAKPVARRPAPRLSGGAPKAITTISMPCIPAPFRLGWFAMPAPRPPHKSGGFSHAA